MGSSRSVVVVVGCVCVVEVGECRSVVRARRGRKAKLDANAEARLPCECARVGGDGRENFSVRYLRMSCGVD
jgi:hypothetical protein